MLIRIIFSKKDCQATQLIKFGVVFHLDFLPGKKTTINKTYKHARIFILMEEIVRNHRSKTANCTKNRHTNYTKRIGTKNRKRNNQSDFWEEINIYRKLNQYDR